MSLWSRKPFIAVRLLGKHGQYPSFALRFPTHVFVADSEAVWTPVVQQPLPEDWELGESTALVPEEVRLLAAITLCEGDPWNHGMPLVTHWNERHLPADDPGIDLTHPDVFARMNTEAHAMRSRPQWGAFEVPSAYEIRELGSYEDAVDLLTNIDSTDQLLLAGLARLLGANRLLTVAHETEEAAISLFISMGAALEFVRLSLAAAKNVAEVPFAEVNAYFRQHFPNGDDVVEYFEARNEERVIAVHPANRFGEFWAPPLMMSDVYHLRRTLLHLYRHILLGEIPAE